MRLFARLGMSFLALAILGAGALDAQEALTKQDKKGPVTVTVTLTAAPAIGTPIRARVALNTHSVGLDGIAFDRVALMQAPDGREVAPTAVEEVQGSGHHRSAVLVFPAPTQAGPVRIVVKDVGGVPERSFVWALAATR